MPLERVQTWLWVQMESNNEEVVAACPLSNEARHHEEPQSLCPVPGVAAAIPSRTL